MLIAIDGPAASGRGTIAKKVAEHYGLKYLDTGKLYRAFGYLVLNGAENSDIENESYIAEKAEEISALIDEDLLSKDELNTEEVGSAASIVSAITQVRKALLELQKQVANSEQGAVLDGRDIGTVVCPNANFKFFITAQPEVRAERRYKQLQNSKKDVTKQRILQDILARDKRDEGRSVAPLHQAEDAFFIDTSYLRIEDVLKKVLDIVDSSA